MFTAFDFLVKGTKHQGNVYCYMFCRFNTAVDTCLKPLLSTKMKSVHRCVVFKMFRDKEERACTICKQSVGVKEKKTHWNFLLVI